MCLPNFMKFHHCLFKIEKPKCRGQTDGKTDGQCETVYPPTNTFKMLWFYFRVIPELTQEKEAPEFVFDGWWWW